MDHPNHNNISVLCLISIHSFEFLQSRNFFHKSNMKRFVNTLWKKNFLEIFQRVLKFWTKYIDFFPKCVVNLHQHFYQDIKCALKKSMYKSQNMDFVLNWFCFSRNKFVCRLFLIWYSIIGNGYNFQYIIIITN